GDGVQWPNDKNPIFFMRIAPDFGKTFSRRGDNVPRLLVVLLLYPLAKMYKWRLFNRIVQIN
ncbi:hypothetical protein, partial [Klebsiella aerogenes]|uniref:hypothetical protein n=1 Tax=Klebsiella aerogenes TaxID=548 RepID=UPI001BCDCC09